MAMLAKLMTRPPANPLRIPRLRLTYLSFAGLGAMRERSVGRTRLACVQNA